VSDLDIYAVLEVPAVRARGAICRWSMSLAGSEVDPPRPQLDWHSIADVVLTLRYTARYDSGLVSLAAATVEGRRAEVRESALSTTLQVGVSMRRDAPDAWSALLDLADVTTTAPVLRMPFDRDRLSYAIAALSPTVTKAHVVLWVADGVSGAAAVVKVGLNATGAPDQGPSSTGVTIGGRPAATVPLQSPAPSPGPTQQLAVELGALTGVLAGTKVDPTTLLDVIVLLDLAFA
jgi:hypothetical protein